MFRITHTHYLYYTRPLPILHTPTTYITHAHYLHYTCPLPILHMPRGVGRGGGRGVSDPPIQKYGGGEVCFAPPMKYVLINFIYIKCSILSLLIQFFF